MTVPGADVDADAGADVDVDVVVVGAGVAGAATALAAARGGRRVLVLVRDRLGDGATPWAQGGLAAALGPGDSPAAHARDTLTAGAGLCDEAAVRDLTAEAPQAIAAVRALGARFDGPDGRPAGTRGPLELTREGGHAHARIVHAADRSGAQLSRALLGALAAAPVEVAEHTLVLDVLTVEPGQAAGVLVAPVEPSGRLGAARPVRARAVVLATGGLGQAYHVTTNPYAATGSGLGLALRAGAPVVDVEFVQFHPTLLWQGPAATGQQVLLSEALRGEGAVLLDATGRRVMDGVHPLGDLAPRDVVAAAMHARMGQAPGGVGDHLWLDATRLGRHRLERHFPGMLAACRAAGYDPVAEPVPVAPGAHYACGGVEADLHGRTRVPGLFAVGEVAATGVHGANRLASNSLVEGLVAGTRTGRALARQLPPAVTRQRLRRGVARPAVDPATRPATAAATSAGAGMLRTAAGLTALLDHLDRVAGAPVPPTALADLAAADATDLHLVSRLVARAALARAESRGCHRRADATATRPDLARRRRLWLAEGRVVGAVDEPSSAA